MKLAVFDIDGTLTKTFAVDGECYLQAFADALGIESVNSNWSDYEHVTDSGVMNSVFATRFHRAPSLPEVSKFIERFVFLLEERYELNGAEFVEIPGALSFLASLRPPSDWRVAIATGGWRSSARLKLETVGLDIQGLPAAFAEDGPSRKSILQTAIERACSLYNQQAFQRIVSVGDAVWDVRTAKQLDLPFVGVAKGDRATVLRDSGASHVVANFLDRSKCLRNLEEALVPPE